MTEQPLAVVELTPEEVLTMLEYSAFLRGHGLTRALTCTNCGESADLGNGETGWKCGCRILVWRTQAC